MICSNCGKENKGNARFCSGCGRPMESMPQKENELIFQDNEGRSSSGEVERTMNIQSNLDSSAGKEPVSMGWIAFSKVCMAVECMAFTATGIVVGDVLTNSGEGVFLFVFGLIGFGISLIWILWQALITAICQNLYINVINTNILIKKVQVLSEQIERQNEILEK